MATTTKDYYDLLGVAKSASDDEIKKAYRQKAREHHPDVVSSENKEAAEKRFKEINEAYQVLSDSQKRKMYDQFGHAGVGGAGAGGQGPFGGGFGAGGSSGAQGQWGPFSYTYSNGGGQQGADFDPFDIFEEVFGFRGFGGAHRSRRGKNLYYEMHIDFGEAVRGVEKKVTVESGQVTIKIPAGVHNGTELRFAGKGMSGPQGMPAGDLLISVRVPTPKQFQRSGDYLVTSVEVDFVTAILGGDIAVPVVDAKIGDGIGSAKLKIPAGTQPHTQFRLKGKGMPRLRGSGNGDVIVQVFVVIPKKVDKRQKSLLEDF